MTDAPDPAEREAIEKAWRLLHLQADAMLKLAETRTQVWKVAVGAFIAGALVAAVTAALTAALVLRVVDAAEDQADDPRAAYQPTRTGTGLDRIGHLVGIERLRR
jgi:hypothetical protein